MTVRQLIEETGWNCLAGSDRLDTEIVDAYCGDLLSWVMGKGQPDQAWITVQVHMNVIAVAVLREFSCVIIAENANLPEDVIAKAEEEGIPLLESGIPVYASAKKLAELGI